MLMALVPYQMQTSDNWRQSADLELQLSFLQQAHLYRQSNSCVVCNALLESAKRCGFSMLSIYAACSCSNSADSGGFCALH